MMNVDSKYRRWGWGAVIGLAGVILIAGLVVTATLSSTPEADDGETIAEVSGSEEGTVGGAVEAPEEEEPEEETPAEETPAEETPAEETPAEQEPVEEAPVVAQIPTTSTPDEMPETGVKDIMYPIVIMAIVATLVAYNYGMVVSKR